MGMGPREVRAFGIAGLLHDIGKVAIPPDVLNKPGALTRAEHDLIRRHPVDGARMILQSGQQLDLAAVVAYEHHIMLDGNGYPRLHYRRCCHPASHIVHLCDVYDALRTHRPYRSAWEHEAIVEYLEGNAGTEFEPALVKAFVGMLHTSRRELRLLADHRPGNAQQDTAAAAAPAEPASDADEHAERQSGPHANASRSDDSA